MALEDYNSILRQCYAKVAEHTERRNEDARAAFAAAGEDAHAPADISEKVAETSVGDRAPPGREAHDDSRVTMLSTAGRSERCRSSGPTESLYFPTLDYKPRSATGNDPFARQ